MAMAPKKVSLWKILLALTIIMTVLARVHWFILGVVTRSFPDGFEQDYATTIMIIYFLGWLSIPAGFLVSRNEKNKFKWLTWVGYVWLGFFTINFLFSVIEFVISKFVNHGYSDWVLVASVLISAWALYKGLKFPDLITHEMNGPPEIQNFKLAQISDLHIGMLHLNETWLEKVVLKINEQKPDIIAITGDLAEGHFHEISKMLLPLKNLKSTCGVFYITGNHEYIHPGEWEMCLKNLGITPLHNENRIIEFNSQKILIAGIPDKMAPRFRPELVSKPDLALTSEIKTIYKILLAHQPASVFDIQKQHCDLMVAGHTHGGQIFPFHLAVRLQQPMVSGFKKFGQTLVFNHQGTGFWGPPMRWFSRSEIVILKIKSLI